MQGFWHDLHYDNKVLLVFHQVMYGHMVVKSLSIGNRRTDVGYDEKSSKPFETYYSRTRSIYRLKSRLFKNDTNAAFLRAARAGNLEKVLEHLKSNTDINTCNALLLTDESQVGENYKKN
ncbi:unnamed protein product [Darwinula stevensoni]|uniref:Uncharacterized protein n=1 Tax=Darwinula stevensoni TaxID=69355 RepID=A0A7R8XG77_9CRUS|nr:unnamed protein product [Darwinula stevensoni]CAG0891386.1 unnamed protein product [Darwinula stevensoni]